MLRRPQAAGRRAQRGFTLLEVLISVVIFSVGVLALVGLHARALRLSSDAQQRAEAAFLADQLLARMMVADPTTAASFAHRPDGVAACAPTGAASTNAIVTEWLSEVAATLPRATSAQQQIRITGTPANEVTVKLCWKNGASEPPRVLEVTNGVQWQ